MAMRLYQTISAVMLVCLAADVQSSWTVKGVIEINDSAVHEAGINQQSFPMSGQLLVGVHARPNTDVTFNGNIFVVVPDGACKLINVSLASRDARYSATLKVDVANRESGLYQLVFRSQFLKLLQSIPLDHMMARAVAAGCSDQKQANATLVLLHSTDSLQLAVTANRIGSDTSELVGQLEVNEGGNQVSQHDLVCRDHERLSGVEIFDSTCVIDFAPGSARLLSVTLDEWILKFREGTISRDIYVR